MNSGNKHKNIGRITASGIKFLSLLLGIHGSSLVLDIKDFLLKTSLKERAKSLIGPFCCSVNVEAKWCKHSGDPGPEQSVPKIYIDLRGGLLQVCIRCLWLCCWAGLALDDWVFINKLLESLCIQQPAARLGTFACLIWVVFILPYKISTLPCKLLIEKLCIVFWVWFIFFKYCMSPVFWLHVCVP